MGHMGWWRPFGFKDQLEMSDDPVDGLSFFDKRDDSHLATTYGATQGIHRCQKIKRNRFWCPYSVHKGSKMA